MRGQKAYDWSGRRRPVREETKLLFTYDKYSRMVCGVGLLDKIQALLKLAGFTVTTQDLNPVHPRKDRYQEDWDNVLNNFSFRARQDECLAKIASHDRGVIDACTGYGKSYLYQALGLLYPKANIVICTRRKDIVESIRLNLSIKLPNIGQIGGGIYKPSRITVSTANSLHKVDAENTDIFVKIRKLSLSLR